MLGKSIWRDEGASLYSAHLGWGALWKQSVVVDRVFLPYYALLHIWVEISSSVEWIRFLSVLAFGLTIVLIGHLGNRLGGYWCGVIAAFVTATNPLMISAALDARPYALSTLAATIAVFSLLRWRDGTSDRWFWLFCIAMLGALALHVFAVLGPLAVFAVMLLLRPARFRREWRSIVGPLSGTLVLGFLFAFEVLGQRGQVAWIPPPSVTTLTADAYGPASGYPHFDKVLYAAIIAASVVLGLAFVWRGRHPGSDEDTHGARENLALAVAWGALPTIGLVAVSFIKPLYVDRYVTASAPGLALAVGLILAQSLKLGDRSRPAKQRRGEVFVAGIVAVGLITNMVVIASVPYANYSGVAQYLHHRVGATGEIALPDHAVDAGIEYYLAETNEKSRLWPENSGQHQIMSLDLRESRSVLTSAEPDVWIVEDATAGLGTFVKILKSDGYILVSTRRFVNHFTVTVAHYERRG